MRFWYRSVCLLLAGALLVLAGSRANLAGAGQSDSGRYLVLIVMDGFRPDYMQLAPMHHLHALMNTGTSYSRAWVGQLETETPTGHATLVTGVYPRKHGVLGFGWRDAATQNFSWMPTDMRQLQAGNMERLIEAGGVPTISDLIHRSYPGSKTASLSGEKYYAADAMGTGADYILYGKTFGQRMAILAMGQHVPPASTHFQSAGVNQEPYPEVQDLLAARLTALLVRTVRPRAMLINLPGTDIEGHITGGVIDRKAMARVVAGADHAIGVILAAYKQAGLYNRTDFIVTADHGMVPNSHLVPFKTMYAGVRATKALYLEDDFLTTGGYLYLRNPADAPAVAAYMAARHYPGVEGGLYRVQSGSSYAFKADPSTAAALGPALTRAYLDLSDTLATPTGPEVVLPYAEDTMGLRVPHQIHWGNHGGLSWRTQHIPLVISGPGVAHGVSAFPAQLVDVAPTMERLLGLPIPRGVDGVVLANALQRPTAQETAAQRALAAPRTADVDALSLHSQREHGAVLTMSMKR